MASEDDGEPQGPVFFLSYARARKTRSLHAGPLESDAFVLRLFDDLTQHVDQLVGSPPGEDPGFVDRAIDSGTRWSPDLRAAAGSCQVFVPLVSMNYIRSRWCAMEWDAFARRPVAHRRAPGTPRPSTAILPVRWSPLREGVLPARLSDVQFFEPQHLTDPGIVPRYVNEGVYGLLALKDEVAYQAVAWRLAQRIAAIFHEYRVAVPDTLPNPSELHTSFENLEDVAG